MYCWNGNNINFNKNIPIMAIIRWFLEFFGKSENKLEENLKEWDRNFEKGKLKKGRRFH